jgi:hypothetical protein
MSVPEIEPEIMSLIGNVADAISREENRALSGDDPTGGHGYYATALEAVVATLRWFETRGVMMDPDQLDAVVDKIRATADVQAWAYLKGGPRHGK